MSRFTVAGGLAAAILILSNPDKSLAQAVPNAQMHGLITDSSGAASYTIKDFAQAPPWENWLRAARSFPRSLGHLDREIAVLEEQLERLRFSQQMQEKDALALDHERRKLTEELARANSRLSVARLELDRLSKETERTLELKVRNMQAVAAKDQARREQEEALESARQTLEELEAEVTRALEEHAALRVELASLEERHR